MALCEHLDQIRVLATDETVCEAHPYNGPHLHLQMAQDPLFP